MFKPLCDYILLSPIGYEDIGISVGSSDICALGACQKVLVKEESEKDDDLDFNYKTYPLPLGKVIDIGPDVTKVYTNQIVFYNPSFHFSLIFKYPEGIDDQNDLLIREHHILGELSKAWDIY